MVNRDFWVARIEEAWRERPIVWLTGVRRVGKTTLASSLPDTTSFDCELPRVRRMIEEDFGQLWEHLVLDELTTRYGSGPIFYWRDKLKHEMDFILARRGQPPLAIDCKWKVTTKTPVNFNAFRTLYPDAKLVLCTTDSTTARFNRRFGWIETGLANLEQAVEMASVASP